jgi:hypothetical protein
MKPKMVIRVIGHYQDTIHIVIEPPKKEKEK